MRHLLKVCLAWLFIVYVTTVGLGQNGCPSGIGYWTNQDEATLAGSSQPIPSAVTCLRATDIQFYEVTLNWQDNSNNENGFKIERKVELGDYAEIALLDANVISFTDSTIISCTNYTYRIKAYNDHDGSMYSNEAEVIALPLPEAPPIPSNVSVTTTSNSYTRLSWEENYSGWLSFLIQRKVGITNTWTTRVDFSYPSVSGRRIEIADGDIISPTATYFYRLKAYHEYGQSDWSEEVWITMPVE